MTANDDRLESWKEIAAYLGKGVRTVIRWEKTEGLPVHRHQHESRASVYASKAELDEWWRSRPTLGLAAAEPHAEQTPRRPPLSRTWLVVGIPLLVACASASVWYLTGESQAPDVGLRIEPLTFYPGSESSPTFSPDGNHFAYSWNRAPGQDIWVQTLGLAEPRRLTSDPAYELSPAWSPDGRWIAFVRRTPSFSTSLHLVPANGGPERHLWDVSIPLYADATQLSWSPDSQWLVFPDAPANQPGLYMMNLQTGERRRLTESSRIREELDPAFSSDGRTLAFRCRHDQSVSEICILPLTADFKPERKAEQITRLGLRSTSPVWTSDGKAIFFSAGIYVSSGGSVYHMTVFPSTARSASPRRLTHGFGEEHYSLAVPPGARLPAFTRKRSEFNIWETVSDGKMWGPAGKVGGLSSTGHDMDPDFSPDGRSIVFTSDRSGSMELWIAESRGHNTRQLTNFKNRFVQRPRFSPDGNVLAFSEGEQNEGAVWVMSASGGSPRELIRRGSYPSWSRDGQFIYYSNREGLFRVPAGGSGSPVQIAGAGSCCGIESGDGRIVWFLRDGAVWKAPAGGGSEDRVLPSTGLPPILFRFAWSSEGIYTFYELLPRPPINLYRFSDGVSIEVFRLNGRSAPGFAVSPDSRRILFAQEDNLQVDIAILRSETK